jgi:hypothetical protein
MGGDDVGSQRQQHVFGGIDIGHIVSFFFRAKKAPLLCSA